MMNKPSLEGISFLPIDRFLGGSVDFLHTGKFNFDAGVDVCGFSCCGVGREINEDAVIFSAEGQAFYVIDGVGGCSGPNGNGLTATKMLGKALLGNPRDPVKVCSDLHTRMDNFGACFAGGWLEDVKDDVMRGDAGVAEGIAELGLTPVCALGSEPRRALAGLSGRKILRYFWSGDCVCVVFDKNGQIQYLNYGDSLVNDRIQKGELAEVDRGVVAERNIFLGGVGLFEKRGHQPLIIKDETIVLDPGSIVLIGTDGVFDNLTPQEVGHLLDQVKQTSGEFTESLRSVIYARMFNARALIQGAVKSGKSGWEFPDGYRNLPKLDNFSLIRLDIPNLEERGDSMSLVSRILTTLQSDFLRRIYRILGGVWS